MTARNVLGMLLLVVLLGVGFWWMQREGDSVGSTFPSSLVDPFSKDEVIRVTAETAGRQMDLRRNPEDRERWDLVVGTQVVRANAIIVDEILNAIARTPVRNGFDPETIDERDLAAYGLGEPHLTFTLEIPGKTLSARFGAATREGTGVYADRGPGSWVVIVESTPLTEFVNAFNNGARDPRLTDVRTYDVKSVEITSAGVVLLEASKDLSQIWHVTQPYKGYAEPTPFETVLGTIVNERWKRVAEDGAQDLQKFGLARPEYEIHLRTKSGGESVLLVGARTPADDGSRFAMEKDLPTVFEVSARFGNAVAMSPSEYRDRSFSRIGVADVRGLTVRLGDGDRTYKIDRVHTDWEISEPQRLAADGERIRDVLELIKTWSTKDFLDGVNAEDHGLSEDGHLIQLELQDGDLVTFLIGKEFGEDVYAIRQPDGGVEVVDGEPIRTLQEGWLQFRRRKGVREFIVADIERIGLEKGFGDTSTGMRSQAWKRDVGATNESWRQDGPGAPGGPDAAALSRLLGRLETVTCLDWIHFDPRHAREAYGILPDGTNGATLRLEITHAERSGLAPTLLTETLIVGTKRPGGGYFAWFLRDRDWAFVLAEDVVDDLKLLPSDR